MRGKTCSCVLSHCMSFALQRVPWSAKIFQFSNDSHSGGKGTKVLLIRALGVHAGSVPMS